MKTHKKVNEYGYWGHGDYFTGWDDMICSIEDRYSHGKKFEDMTDDEKHAALVEYATHDITIGGFDSTIRRKAEAKVTRFAADLVWGKRSDWPAKIDGNEFIKLFGYMAIDDAIDSYVDDIRECLKEHEVKEADMDKWLRDEVMKCSEVAPYINSTADAFEKGDAAKLEKAFETNIMENIGKKMWKTLGGKAGIIDALANIGEWDLLGSRAFDDHLNIYTRKPAQTSPEQICSDWDNFVANMGFEVAPEWFMDMVYQRAVFKYTQFTNTSWSNPGGKKANKTYAEFKAMMRGTSVNENTKITLTIKQLKQLVREARRR